MNKVLQHLLILVNVNFSIYIRVPQIFPWRANLLQSLSPALINSLPVMILKTLISLIRCVWLVLQLNSLPVMILKTLISMLRCVWLVLQLNSLPVMILKTLISLIRCVWLVLQLNSLPVMILKTLISMLRCVWLVLQLNSLPVMILKTLISLIRCVWLVLQLNSAGVGQIWGWLIYIIKVVLVVHELCLLTLVNALWTNMNKQWTDLFLLTNFNKD